MKCEICDAEECIIAWTDAHGVAECTECGAPYRIFHYEGEGDAAKRVDKPPTLEIKPESVALMRRYWLERKQPMHFGYSFMGYRGESGAQCVATRAQVRAFYDWLDAQAATQEQA